MTLNFSFLPGLMIYRNETLFDIEVLERRFESDVDPSDYVQYIDAMECVEWQGTFNQIRFS